MRRILVFVFTLLVVLVCFFAMWSFYGAPQATEAKVPRQNYAMRKDGSVKVPADFAWDKLSRDELNEFADLFPKDQKQNKFRLETVVSAGERIVTSVYEGGGEFAITELVPVVKRDEKGEAYVEMGILTKGISATGEQRTIVSRSMKLVVKGSYTLGAPVVSGEENTITGYYTIDLRAKAQEGSNAVWVEASGRYESVEDNRRKSERGE